VLLQALHIQLERSEKLMTSKSLVTALLLANSLFLPALSKAQSAPAPAPAPAATPTHSFTYNVGLVTDYRYRGISQSGLNPALQGGVDYSHASGAYLGLWATTITWITDAAPANKGRLEIDIYGGYKGTAGPISYDVGLLQYWYAGNNLSPNANTLEIYGAGTYGPFTAKYSHSLSNLFGFVDSKGSGYLDLSATFDLGNGWGVTPHVGRQRIAGNGDFSYTDFSLTVTKEAFGLVFSGMVVATDSTKALYTNPQNKYLGKTGIVLGVKKNF
jgi:uncharacterized protein (TIGR02001 family)